MDNKFHAAQMLIRHTFMNEHPAFNTTDCEVNQIDWEKILQSEYTKQQEILLEVLEFLIEGKSEMPISELLQLNDDDLQAVMLSLSEKFKPKELQENL